MVQALLHAGDDRGSYLEPQIDVGVHCQSDAVTTNRQQRRELLQPWGTMIRTVGP